MIQATGHTSKLNSIAIGLIRWGRIWRLASVNNKLGRFVSKMYQTGGQYLNDLKCWNDLQCWHDLQYNVDKTYNVDMTSNVDITSNMLTWPPICWHDLQYVDMTYNVDITSNMLTWPPICWNDLQCWHDLQFWYDLHCWHYLQCYIICMKNTVNLPYIAVMASNVDGCDLQDTILTSDMNSNV